MQTLKGLLPFRTSLGKRHDMKKIDVDKDYKRTKFLIVAMIVQIIVVFLSLYVYFAWLKS